MAGPSNHPAAAYPSWLRRPLVPVQVIIGPPGNGATLYAQSHAAASDIIIDVAAIITEISGQPSTTADAKWIIAALQRRNEMLEALSDAATVEAKGITGAWLISPAPLQWQRDFWSARLGAAIVLLDPGKQATLDGARAEGVAERWVHRWYAEAQDAMAGLIAPATRQTPPPIDTRPQAARESSGKRGYGSTHRTLRDKQLAREPWCRFCWEERQVKVRATVLDHELPFRRADGSMDYKLWGDPKNHRSLCQPCHDARGAQRNRAEKPPGAGGDGRPMDPAHPWNRK